MGHHQPLRAAQVCEQWTYSLNELTREPAAALDDVDMALTIIYLLLLFEDIDDIDDDDDE